ncbi:MAG: YfhO family protein, partial [Lachnospiraceae bacterium]|nr:YfhO family protein [Lachnospiraceae bacterium]
ITGRNDEETYGRWIAGTDLFDLKEGMYEVAVDYWSLLYDTEVGGNCEDSTGTLQIVRTKLTEDKLCYNDLVFQDGHTHQRTRLWIRDIGGEKGLQLMVNFYGVGELRVDKIVIRELPVWRFMRLLAWLLGFLILDAVYVYFFISDRASNKPAAAILIFAVFYASLPLLTDSLFWGHDLDFHLNRIMALANGLEAGHLFVPIQTEVQNGYGYASPLFYSQLFLYVPAVLYNLAVPIQVCYQIYAILVNIMTDLIAYYSFKGLVKDNKIAAAGAFIYLLSAYRITNLYIRAAVGEYTAMAFFPLIIYGFVRVYTTDEKKLGIRDYLPIVIGLSGLIESHVLSCELSAIFIVIVCLVNYKKTFQIKRFITLTKAAALTLFLNMAFIIPFIDSMHMNIRVNNEPINHIQVHGAYLQQVFSAFQVSFGDSRRGMNTEMPLSLGIALVFGMIIFAACCSLQNEWRTRKSGIVKAGVLCTVFASASIILSLRFFPWDSLENICKPLAKVLCIVQFPWRYLSMATIFATVTTVIGLYVVKELKSIRTMQILAGALCLITVLSYSLYMAGFTDGINTERVYGDADVEKAISSGEYIINGTIEGNLRWRKINANTSFVTVSDYLYEGGVTTFDCVNT